MKVLVADDDVTTRLIISKQVESWGYRVETAENGREAIEILSKPDPPRIAILDWMMPEVDGVEVCAQLEKLQSEQMVYRILLTSRIGQEHLVRAFGAGAHDYIAKPPNIAELRCRIDVGRRLVEGDDLIKAYARMMERQAMTDPLTDIHNRRSFFEVARYDLAKAMQTHSRLTVLIMDIDHYKEINDTYGHEVGDRVLKQFVELISPLLSPSDTFARIGGEEFVLLISDVDDASHLAERLRAKIQESDFIGIGSDRIKITVSIGMSCLSPVDESIDEALNRADKALYEAKSNGRNQAIVAR